MVLSDIINEYTNIEGYIQKCESYLLHLDYFEKNLYDAVSTFLIKEQMDLEENKVMGEKIEIQYVEMLRRILRTKEKTQSCLEQLLGIIPDNSLLKETVGDIVMRTRELGHIINDELINTFQNGVKSFPMFYILKDIREIRCELNKLSWHYALLQRTEEQLREPLPEGEVSGELENFEIRSYKSNLDFSSYAHDLLYLSKFISQVESVLNVTNPLFVRRIESGSLKIMWSGNEIEISCISEIINSIIAGIKSFAFLKIEKERKKLENEKLTLENEALEIQNKSKKLRIVNSQIDTIAEKLGLDKNNPEDVEKIQMLCSPLIDYLESNPIGCIGDQKYNIDEGIKLLSLNSHE